MTILVQSRPSNGASALVAAIRARGENSLRRRAGATSRLRRSSMLVNWGCSTSAINCHLNPAGYVGRAVDKTRAFVSMFSEGVSVPKFVASPHTLEIVRAGYVNERGCIWLARHSLTGHGGEGITIVRPGDTFPDAPLYVQYIPKLLEFRVHVFKGSVLTRQKLRQSTAEQDRDQRLIRNRENGWVFGLVRDEAAASKAEAEAKKAVEALGLDFGAADVVIGRDDGKAYVLEVNTAPGLEEASSASTEFYADNIIKYYRSGAWR